MEPDQKNLASLFPSVAAQMRGALSNLHLAAAQLAPAEAREQDPALDARAAVLEMGKASQAECVHNGGHCAAVVGGIDAVAL